MKTLDHYDVVVAGGGTAGACAAIAAARTGARTLVVEPYSYLGGNLSLGMNLLGAADAEGHWALGGVGRELVDRLERDGGATPVSLDPQFGSILGFDPELAKIVLLELAVEAGVNVLYHALVVDAVVTGGSVTGLVVATKQGVRTIDATVTVDCTGDADVLAKAGGAHTVGRDPDHRTQPASRIFRAGDVDLKRVYDYLAENPEDLKPPAGWSGGDYDIGTLAATPGATIEAFGGLIQRARAAGDWTIPRWRLGLYTMPGRSEVGVNVTRIHGVDGTDPDDVTRADIETVLQMAEVMRFLRKYVPGFENSRIVSAPHQVGIRETRRVRGGYALTQEDVVEGRSFDDQVARGAYPLDVHDVEPGSGGSLLWPIRQSFGIPVRCLVPSDVGRLVVAGRAVSATHEAAGSTRGQAVCMVTGHAAGTLAALAAALDVGAATDGGAAAPWTDERAGDPVAAVAVAELQDTLRAQGAILERGRLIESLADGG